MTRHPDCDPATLREQPCAGDCGRRLHNAVRNRRGRTAACRRGHPIHVGRGLCTTCRGRVRKAGRLHEFPLDRPDTLPAAPILHQTDTDWMGQAACRGAGVEFVPGRLNHDLVAELTAAAEDWCDGCPVIADCARLADERHETGLWGGVLRYLSEGRYQWTRLVDAAVEPRPRDRRLAAAGRAS